MIDEDEITAYIWDANGDRRNLSKGQRAMLAALRPGAQSSLSEETGVANGYIARARQVIHWCDSDDLIGEFGQMVDDQAGQLHGLKPRGT